MMNVTDYTNIKTLLIKFKQKSDVLYAKASALSNYATIEWVGTQIPSVGNGTVTIKQNGTSKGSFTMNQSGATTIELTDNNTTYSSLAAKSGGTNVSLVTTGEKYTWDNKQASISDLSTIRSNAATAHGWGDHSKAGYIRGITKAMVESVLTGNITSHTHTFASLTSKPTTLSGYGIVDASRIFRYTIPASGNKGVRITFSANEPVKITVSGINQNAQLMLVGTGYGPGGFERNNFTELVQSTSHYRWCLSDEKCSVEVFSTRTDVDYVTVVSPVPVIFTAISALSKPAVARHLLSTANYPSYVLPLYGGTITGSIRMNGLTSAVPLIRNFSGAYNGGWSRNVLECRVDDKNAFRIAPFGEYTSGAANNKIQYVSLGFAEYNGLNLRISDTSLTWGDSDIYHEGNSNNFSTVWSAKRLATPHNLICPYSWAQDGSATGIIVLSLPYGFNSMMHCLELTLYNYGANPRGATKFFINGYNYNNGDSSEWTLPTASRIGANVGVKFGYYKDKCCILIGATNSVWNFPRLCVDKVYGLHSATVDSFKDNNWSCTILRDESEITKIIGAYGAPLYAPCYTLSGLPYVTDNDVAGKYLKLTGGNITGSIRLDGDTLSPFLIRNFSGSGSRGWSREVIDFRVDGKNAFLIGGFGEYVLGNANNKMYYAYLGFASYNGLNLRISETDIKWGDSAIYHAGNSNKSDVNWACKALTAATDITANGIIYAKTGMWTNGYISAKQASASSDKRLKTDFRSIENALDYILGTHYTRFRWKDDNKESIGIIAQEEQGREYGFLVQNHEKIGHLTYDYAASTALLGAAIQEEDSKVERLKKRIEELENELSNLKKTWLH